MIRGDGGTDWLVVNGNGASEMIEVSADGPRLRFFRNVGNVTLNVDGVEQVLYRAAGGADTVTVRNLAPTDVGRVILDLAGTLGGTAGDGQIDTVIVNGTSKRDLFTIRAVGTTAKVFGLAARVRIAHPDAAFDELIANGLGGHDRFTIGSGLPALIGVTVNQ